MKKIWVVLMVVLGCLAVGVVTASAGDGHNVIKSKVTINFEPGTYSDSFFGKVKSDNNKCVKDRKVKIIQKQSGDSIGDDTTDNDGNYTVNLGDYAASGKYYARATKKVLDSGKRCKPADSDKVTVP